MNKKEIPAKTGISGFIGMKELISNRLNNILAIQLINKSRRIACKWFNCLCCQFNMYLLKIIDAAPQFSKGEIR